jgi:MFS family permease
MPTTTPRPDTTQAETESMPSTVGRTFQGWFLIGMVFVAGACSLAVELTASRLLAPDFGTSLFVWANLIGLILLYLTIGYYVGGRLADRYPRPAVLYTLTAVAAVWIAGIPAMSQSVLAWSLTVFGSLALGDFYGSLIAILVLFSVPMILLGCVSPYAIRLRVEQIGKTGRTAGQLYAIATAGSIVGTFLPVLALMPGIGTRLTFFVFAITLLVMSLLGLLTSRVGKR